MGENPKEDGGEGWLIKENERILDTEEKWVIFCR